MWCKFRANSRGLKPDFYTILTYFYIKWEGNYQLTMTIKTMENWCFAY